MQRPPVFPPATSGRGAIGHATPGGTRGQADTIETSAMEMPCAARRQSALGRSALGRRTGPFGRRRQPRSTCMADQTLHEFLDLLQRSRLLSSKQFAGVRKSALSKKATSKKATSLKVARSLVKSGKLTVWQAERLLGGSSAFFLDKYKFLEPIGEGAMGVVFKARHAVMGRTVALKVLSKTRLSHPTALARFYREVQAVAALDHPNIVTAYDAGQAGDTHYLVMELIDGIDLEAWLQEFGRVDIPSACEFIRQAARGLHHAHLQGMVHRDIKPANILVSWNSKDSQPLVKVLDLGLARIFSEGDDALEEASANATASLDDTAETHLTQAGMILGTPDYLAPEQVLEDQDVDARTDIFSLGCTLFKLITGELPYGGPDLWGKLQARVSPSAPPAVKLRTLLPEADMRLESVVTEMLERDPAKRMQTAAQVAEALKPFARPGLERPKVVRRDVEKESAALGTTQITVDPGLQRLLNELADDEMGNEAEPAPPG